MAVTQYIGARYVPLFADPAEWDSTREYEPLTVVLNQGASYTSRQYVPIGIDISNTDFWVRTADYNAQVNQYRQEVQTFDGRITANTTAISDETSAREDADDALDARVTANATAISDETSAREDADDALDARVTELEGDLDDESAARIAADSALDSRLSMLGLNTGVSDTTQQAQSLQALIDEARASITELLTDVGTLRDEVDQIQVSSWDGAKYAGTNVVFFGDSYMAENVQNSNYAWLPNNLCSRLNATKFNFSYGGAGWGRSTNLMETQVDSAAATMSSDERNNTSLVIAMAGCNDLLNDVPQSDISSGYNRFMGKVASNFPNAKVVVVPFNWGSAHLTHARQRVMLNSMSNMKLSSNTAKVAFAENSAYWNLGVFSHFQNEVHPNETGYRVILANILSVIFGGGSDAYLGSGVAFASGSGSMDWEFKNGIVNAHFHFSGASALNNYTAVLNSNLHPILVPENDIWFDISSNNRSDGTTYSPNGVVRISSGGALVIRVASLAANEVISGAVSYAAVVNKNWSA